MPSSRAASSPSPSSAASVLALAATAAGGDRRRRCHASRYRPDRRRSTMPIAGTGFTPGALVTIRHRAEPPDAGVPHVGDGRRRRQLRDDRVAAVASTRSHASCRRSGCSATDGANPALVATTTYKQVRVGYTTNPPTRPPDAQRRRTPSAASGRQERLRALPLPAARRSATSSSAGRRRRAATSSQADGAAADALAPRHVDGLRRPGRRPTHEDAPRRS